MYYYLCFSFFPVVEFSLWYCFSSPRSTSFSTSCHAGPLAFHYLNFPYAKMSLFLKSIFSGYRILSWQDFFPALYEGDLSWSSDPIVSNEKLVAICVTVTLCIIPLSLAMLKFFSLSFASSLFMMWHIVGFLKYPSWGFSWFPNWEVFCHYFLKYFFCPVSTLSRTLVPHIKSFDTCFTCSQNFVLI